MAPFRHLGSWLNLPKFGNLLKLKWKFRVQRIISNTNFEGTSKWMQHSIAKTGLSWIYTNYQNRLIGIIGYTGGDQLSAPDVMLDGVGVSGFFFLLARKYQELTGVGSFLIQKLPSTFLAKIFSTMDENEEKCINEPIFIPFHHSKGS